MKDVRRAYERMDRETAAHRRGEEVAEDARLACPAGPVTEMQGYDPRQDPPPAERRPRREPKVYTLRETVVLWAIYETGALDHPTHDVGRDDELWGVDVPRLAWDWVAETEGWSPVVRQVMRHLFLRHRDWSHWPATTPVLAHRVRFPDGEEAWLPCCPWPFVTKRQALAEWGPFLLALKEKARESPFVPMATARVFREVA